LLCAGKDSGLLKSRCAVLRYSGYDVQAATLGEAEALLHDQVYDLVIISAQLTDREEARMLSVAGKTPTYVLDGLTLAGDLLDQVKQRLPDTARLDHTHIADSRDISDST
jgi:DNA-binding response OmpR family regulator